MRFLTFILALAVAPITLAEEAFYGEVSLEGLARLPALE